MAKSLINFHQAYLIEYLKSRHQDLECINVKLKLDSDLQNKYLRYYLSFMHGDKYMEDDYMVPWPIELEALAKQISGAIKYYLIHWQDWEF